MNNRIIDYLDEIIPFPRCELNYNKDYELLICVMLSAQTTDKRVNSVSLDLFSKYDRLDKLSSASVSDIEKIIYSLGNYKKKSVAVVSIAKAILDIGYVPNDRVFLESLPMVGRKTVSVVLSELFNEPNIAVDTHVLRVSKRLGITSFDSDVLATEKDLKKFFPREKWCRLHLQLVIFGRYYCTSKCPKCDNCRFKDFCLYNKEEDKF